MIMTWVRVVTVRGRVGGVRGGGSRQATRERAREQGVAFTEQCAEMNNNAESTRGLTHQERQLDAEGTRWVGWARDVVCAHVRAHNLKVCGGRRHGDESVACGPEARVQGNRNRGRRNQMCARYGVRHGGGWGTGKE